MAERLTVLNTEDRRILTDAREISAFCRMQYSPLKTAAEVALLIQPTDIHPNNFQIFKPEPIGLLYTYDVKRPDEGIDDFECLEVEEAHTWTGYVPNIDAADGRENFIYPQTDVVFDFRPNTSEQSIPHDEGIAAFYFKLPLENTQALTISALLTLSQKNTALNDEDELRKIIRALSSEMKYMLSAEKVQL